VVGDKEVVATMLSGVMFSDRKDGGIEVPEDFDLQPEELFMASTLEI
jgi:hypothetical protein